MPEIGQSGSEGGAKRPLSLPLSNDWWPNSKAVDCGGVNFVRNVILALGTLRRGLKGTGWKSTDKAKVSLVSLHEAPTRHGAENLSFAILRPRL